MRGDVVLHLRLLLRGAGLAGVVATLGGGLAIVATRLPWYAATTTVTMLGAQDDRVVATMPGIPETGWGWLAGWAGLSAMGLGVGVALDRPLRMARAGLAAAAVALVAATLGALAWPPELAQVAGSELPALTGLAGRLPVGVGLDLAVARAIGPWGALVAAILVAGGAIGARDR